MYNNNPDSEQARIQFEIKYRKICLAMMLSIAWQPGLFQSPATWVERMVGLCGIDWVEQQIELIPKSKLFNPNELHDALEQVSSSAISVQTQTIKS